MKKYKIEELPNLIIFGSLGIAIICFALYIFNINYGFLSKVVDLNEYLTSDSTIKTVLPNGFVKLKVNKCYGRFYRSSGGRRTPKTDYYIIGLDDGSVMAYCTYSGSRQIQIINDNGKTNSFTIKGKMVHGLEDIAEEYDNHINILKEKGVLPKDVYVRYSSIDDQGGGWDLIILFITLLCIGIILIKLSYDVFRGRSTFIYENKGLQRVLYVGGTALLFSYSFSYPIIFKMIAPCCLIIFLVWNTILQIIEAYNRKVIADSKKDCRDPIIEINIRNSITTEARKLNSFFSKIINSGYSEEILQMTDKVIDDYNNGHTIKMDLFKDYIFQAVKCSLYMDEYSKALEYLDVINLKELSDLKYIEKNGTTALYEYLKLKMEICRGLKLKSLAENTMIESIPYIDPEDLTFIENHYKYVFLYNYYMLFEEYEKAKECAKKVLDNETRGSIEKYLINAEIGYKLNDMGFGSSMIDKARSIVLLGNKNDEQIYYKFLTPKNV